MLDFIAENYLMIKAFHLISVISWMAGLLYLPRLFVYHSVSEVGSQQSETFKVMERRLLKGIMNPAMIMTFLFGGLLLLAPGVMEEPRGWLHLKLISIILLAGSHMAMGRWRKDFEADKNTKSTGFFRTVNEFPTLLMILIVFLVVMKPF